MNDDAMSLIAQLADDGTQPHAGMLNPEVRSGASFTFKLPNGALTTWPDFQVVWFYTVPVKDRASFASALLAFEPASAGLSPVVNYLGTYSVSISSAAPDFEYRTYWSLQTLAAINDLNDLLHAPTPNLKNMLELISPIPAMRSEIMGRTINSAKLTGV